MSIFYKLLIFAIVFFVFDMIFTCFHKPSHKKTGSIFTFFGVPGSGKTTFSAKLVKNDLKKNKTVYSNVPIVGAYQLNTKEDIAKYDISNAHLIIDEAGIDYNNRQYSAKNGMTISQIEWWKYIRHYHCTADLFSQTFNDMDVSLRRLTTDLFIVTRSAVPFFVTARRIRKKIGIDEIQHVPVDMYYMGFPIVDTYRCFMPRYWKMFDSYDAPKLPPKDWTKYEVVTSRFDES